MSSNTEDTSNVAPSNESNRNDSSMGIFYYYVELIHPHQCERKNGIENNLSWPSFDGCVNNTVYMGANDKVHSRF